MKLKLVMLGTEKDCQLSRTCIFTKWSEEGLQYRGLIAVLWNNHDAARLFQWVKCFPVEDESAYR